jgi:cytochrome c oxidase assembly protein subunit 15
MATGDRWLHRFAALTAGATLFLIVAGGLVTSTGSGLAVPDWPLSYGMVFPPMVGGIFYEHGHRMAATFVGFLTTILAVWLWRWEKRRWVRPLGLVALAAVMLQGVLGGLTVLYLLPTPISVAHACLAQTFFCLTVSIALFTSAEWRRRPPPVVDRGWPSLRARCVATSASIYAQLVLGAVMRHTESGLAIPDFPLSFGHLVPPISSLSVNPTAPFPISLNEYRSRVLIHFAHRAWAVAVVICIAWTAGRILRAHRDRMTLVRPALLTTGLVVVQICLGGFVVWTEKAIPIATAHVAVGASILASSVVLTLRVWRLESIRKFHRRDAEDAEKEKKRVWGYGSMEVWE